MTLDTVFLLIHLIVFPCWLLLLIAPAWRGTQKIVHSALVPLILFAVYLYFIMWGVAFGGGAEGGGMTSLSAVMALFDSKVSMIAGWTHYLVFDLFVGAWIARDGARRAIAHFWRIPCLLLTLMFGPVGLGLYLIIRRAKTGVWSLNEAA
jgi:hypothetical protein